MQKRITGVWIGMGLICGCVMAADSIPAWPAVTRENKPWAYNWWPGSAVDPQSLSNVLYHYAAGGLGGIHIVPIYGAKGAEKRYVDYLSPRWMELFACASAIAAHDGLGVDMTTGSGWCFGGPQITREHSGWKHEVKVFEVGAGQGVPRTFRRDRVMGLRAVTADGGGTDLMPYLDVQGRVDWKAGASGAKVVALLADCDKGQPVKRAGPGGKGLMINPFDPAAMRQFLGPYSKAFPAEGKGPKPRAMYHDSYEYFGTSWCDGFLDAFARKRGYRLTDELAAFAGLGDPDRAARVKADYRETLSDLMVEDVFPLWTGWCRARGILTRNEAHGAPANLLDLYALADIPETEMFGHGGRDPLVSRYDADFGKADRNPFISKMASSVAHVKGTRLASAEFGTWLAEHFHETPEEIKCLGDLMFLCGINHLFYHGTCFSPDDAAWPGWLFYASTEMNPRNPIWHDAPLLNGYLARTQAVLQSGKPSNDVLLYWPIYDFWNEDGPSVQQLTVHHAEWMTNQPIGHTSASLWRLGYGFDYVSDRLLSRLQVAGDGHLTTAEGAVYKALMVPSSKLMPAETLERILSFAEAGATVIFCDRMPDDVPGWGQLAARRARFTAARQRVRTEATAVPGMSRATVGKGAVYVGRGDEALALCGIRRELAGVQEGVRCIRRRTADGYYYLLVNHGMRPLDGWVRLAVPSQSVAAMDAMTGVSGVVESRAEKDGGTEVRVFLEPAGAILLATFDARRVTGPAFRFARYGAPLLTLGGPWQVRFVTGGPVLPKPYETAALASWTANGDPETMRFGGTAVYRTIFDAPSGSVGRPVVLDLGRVEVSARVRVNGANEQPAFMTPYRVLLPQGFRAGRNELEVEVTNLAANRIRDLDVRQVPWRIFNDINFVDIRYKGFDARQWSVRDSGLLGPVRVLTWRE